MVRNRDLLMIFCRDPQSGEVKTRLAAGIGRVMATLMYEAFLCDLIDQCSRPVDIDLQLLVTPASRLPEFREFLTGKFSGGLVDVQLMPQNNGDLGARLSEGFRNGFDNGYQHVCAIGTDMPQLSMKTIRHAFATLADSDVVIGPAVDGGYYLIGLATYDHGLFDQMPWSSMNLLEETIDAAHDRRMHVAFLPVGFDVDTIGDVELLKNLKGLERYAPRTQRLLQTIVTPESGSENVS